MYCQLELGVYICSVYVHSYICDKLFGVTVFQRSIVSWSGGFDASSVYEHSAKCDTYLV